MSRRLINVIRIPATNGPLFKYLILGIAGDEVDRVFFRTYSEASKSLSDLVRNNKKNYERIVFMVRDNQQGKWTEITKYVPVLQEAV